MQSESDLGQCCRGSLSRWGSNPPAQVISESTAGAVSTSIIDLPASSSIYRLGATPVLAHWTARHDGDQRPPEIGGEDDGGRVCPSGRSRVWLRQVHGSGVVRVDGQWDQVGVEGDALVTAREDVCLAIFVADCAPVALASPEGVLAAVHAGWRGLMAGVIETTVAAMASMGATRIVGAVGPCVHPECYEFSEMELRSVAERLGDGVVATTVSSRPALDLPAAVASALDASGVALLAQVGECTACSGSYFSHRREGSVERQAMLVWKQGCRAGLPAETAGVHMTKEIVMVDHHPWVSSSHEGART